MQTEIIIDQSAGDKSMSSSGIYVNQEQRNQQQFQGLLSDYSREEQYFYTPVAFVFETLVEHSDFFK